MYVQCVRQFDIQWTGYACCLHRFIMQSPCSYILYKSVVYKFSLYFCENLEPTLKNWLPYFIVWWNRDFYWTVWKLMWHLSSFLLILNFLTLWRTVILCVCPKIAPKSTAIQVQPMLFFTLLHIQFAFLRPISNQLLSRITVGQMWTLRLLIQNKKGAYFFWWGSQACH